MEYNCSSYRGHDKLLKGFHVEELLQQRQEREQHYQGPAKANPAAVRAPPSSPAPAICIPHHTHTARWVEGGG